MNGITAILKGSKSRDDFKHRHKQLLPSLFAIDIDFCLVEKHPIPHVVALIDYKKTSDEITFAEVCAYNHFILTGIPVYIVTGSVETGEFIIEQYMGGHHKKPDVRKEFILKTSNWQEFQSWEVQLRSKSKARFEQKISL